MYRLRFLILLLVCTIAAQQSAYGCADCSGAVAIWDRLSIAISPIAMLCSSLGIYTDLHFMNPSHYIDVSKRLYVSLVFISSVGAIPAMLSGFMDPRHWLWHPSLMIIICLGSWICFRIAPYLYLSRKNPDYLGLRKILGISLFPALLSVLTVLIVSLSLFGKLPPLGFH